MEEVPQTYQVKGVSTLKRLSIW